MLDRQKLLQQLETVSEKLCIRFAKDYEIARSVLDSVKDDKELSQKVHKKKHALLLPKWQGSLATTTAISDDFITYLIAAVDGSQIYYDKHQGPACYLINTGSVLFEYGQHKSKVHLSSHPYVKTMPEDMSLSVVDHINFERESYELEEMVALCKQYEHQELLVLLDGTLIFLQGEGQLADQKLSFLNTYFELLQQARKQNQLIAGYISFPRSKELVNILKLVLVDYNEKELDTSSVLDQLTDKDIASYLLPVGHRSTLFMSMAPVTYLYPQELKPYFCFLNVGFEVVRLEFPAYIAHNEILVNKICHLVYDQVKKGSGYPVCLYEAHEQAVIKSIDRQFFFSMMQRLTQKHDVGFYKKSTKSQKKQYVPV